MAIAADRSIAMVTVPKLKSAAARRVFLWQMAFAVILLAAAAASNTYTAIADAARAGTRLPLWEPALWESTSVACVAALIPAVGWWLTQFPLSPSSALRNLPAHLMATVPFSLLHVAGMVALRDLAYRLLGQHYHFGRWWPNWLYEFRKDIVTYWVLLLALMAFRLYRRSLDGPAAGAAPPAEVPPGEVPPGGSPAERLVVRKLNREYILNVADIDRIDANGNYVSVHAHGTTYPRRESLSALESKLDRGRFVRVHRAHLVNLDRIREIQPWDHGDYRIVLHDGSCVNLSRRYRDRLQHLLH